MTVAVDRLSFTYEGGTGRQLHEVTFDVRRGQRVAVMGATGAGKTTLSMTLNGLIPHLFRGRLTGRVEVEGIEPARSDVGQRVATVGLVMQDPEAQITGRTVLTDAAVGPANLGLDRDDVLRRARHALDLVGLADLAERESDRLSGGQKQRLAIAGVLAMAPPVLVLDEPTSELDPAATRRVFDLVRRLCDDEGRTVVLIDHEVELIAAWAERLLVLAGGAVAFDGPPRELFADPDRAATLGIRVPQVSQVAVRCGVAADRTPMTTDEAVRVLAERVGPMHRDAGLRGSDAPQAPPVPATAPVIEAHALRHVYPAGVTALDGVDITIREGGFVAVVGRNGAGKTTFARHLNGLLRPTAGEVRIAGTPTTARTVADLAADVGYVFQNPDHQIFATSTYDELAYGLRNAGWDEPAIHARVAEVAALVGLDAPMDAHPFRLGKGQRQRLAVASVLALSPRILVIDEPTTGQDAAGARAMLELIVRLNGEGHTIVMITHDMPLVAEYARRVLVFDHARLVADTTPAALFADPDLVTATELAVPQVMELADRLGLPGPVTTVDACVAALEACGVR